MTRSSSNRVHLLLFLATLLTTSVFGTLLAGANPFNPFNWPKGLVFSIPLLLILGAHETAHYLAARRFGVKASLPYFIPAPIGAGTFGAVIKIRSAVPHRQALVALGISGPLVGFILSIGAVAGGLPFSQIIPAEEAAGGLQLGSPLMMTILTVVIKGPIPGGSDLLIHPLVFAGWIGFLVTSLNLFPIGQLDGGHITYALIGKGHRIAARLALATLIPLGLIAWPGWLVWAFLAFFIGLDHHPCLNDRPLGKKGVLPAVVTFLIFGLSFIPVPITIQPLPSP